MEGMNEATCTKPAFRIISNLLEKILLMGSRWVGPQHSAETRPVPASASPQFSAPTEHRSDPPRPPNSTSQAENAGLIPAIRSNRRPGVWPASDRFSPPLGSGVLKSQSIRRRRMVESRHQFTRRRSSELCSWLDPGSPRCGLSRGQSFVLGVERISSPSEHRIESLPPVTEPTPRTPQLLVTSAARGNVRQV